MRLHRLVCSYSNRNTKHDRDRKATTTARAVGLPIRANLQVFSVSMRTHHVRVSCSSLRDRRIGTSGLAMLVPRRAFGFGVGTPKVRVEHYRQKTLRHHCSRSYPTVCGFEFHSMVFNPSVCALRIRVLLLWHSSRARA